MRIIAGTFRGRRLVAPRGLATRPTTDRVREAWFSILGPLRGTVLDLYAGTGALGFEALSRGADEVVFVENARAAVTAIQKNAASLGVLPRVHVVAAAAEASGAALRRRAPFSLVLTDPPWTALEDSEKTLRRLLRADLLEPNARVVLGHPKGRPIALGKESGLAPLQTRSWGDSAATFYGAPEGITSWPEGAQA